ncbi:hypothetical protein ACMA5I_12340 [Paracoccaceae bacterium GXU_MW_L88]
MRTLRLTFLDGVLAGVILATLLLCVVWIANPVDPDAARAELIELKAD